MFASFVKFGSKEKRHTKWQKDDGDVNKAIPEMFIQLSNKCRVDLGYRLLRRALRHSLDIRTESLDNKTAKLILYNGDKVGIHITTPIPASIKKSVYDGTTVLRYYRLRLVTDRRASVFLSTRHVIFIRKKTYI